MPLAPTASLGGRPGAWGATQEQVARRGGLKEEGSGDGGKGAKGWVGVE